MSMSIRIFIFFITLPIFSQTLEGFVIDSITREPLQYASISFLEKDKGVFTDGKGFFCINIEKENEKSLLISFVGYENTVISLKNYTENKIYSKKIALLPKTEVLEEVIVSKKLTYERKTNKVGFFKNKGKISSSMPFAWENTFFIENPKRKLGKVEGITLYFDRGRRDNLHEVKQAYFKVSFYTRGKDGFPKEYITYENLVLKPTEKSSKITLNLSEYDIPFLREGIFVGILPINATTTAPKSSMYVISPYFEYTYTEKVEKFTRFMGKKWKKSNEKSYFKKEYYNVPRFNISIRYQK